MLALKVCCAIAATWPTGAHVLCWDCHKDKASIPEAATHEGVFITPYVHIGKVISALHRVRFWSEKLKGDDLRLWRGYESLANSLDRELTVKKVVWSLTSEPLYENMLSGLASPTSVAPAAPVPAAPESSPAPSPAASGSGSAPWGSGSAQRYRGPDRRQDRRVLERPALSYHVGHNVLQNFISKRAAPGLSYELRRVDAEAMLSYCVNGGDPRSQTGDRLAEKRARRCPIRRRLLRTTLLGDTIA